MSEEKLTSNSLNIEVKSQSYLATPDNISEDIGLDNVINMGRENGESAQDGADEKMLGTSDKEALALKDIPVTFTSGNGDAKIEIGNVEKAFTGMTKDELMKYANDPFWVKLRWVLFIGFWALWIGMLVGAILIIVFAPKCNAPTPLVWYENGPLITIKDVNDGDLVQMKNLDVQGVVYELPAEETYLIGEPDSKIEERIKEIVTKYNAVGIQVILDLTPNYVTQEDKLFKDAMNTDNFNILDAFVTTKRGEINWLKVNAQNGEKAFKLYGKNIFLSQFGDNIDVKLDNPLIEEKFKSVLSQLADLGVKGFRLKNAKHFLIKDTNADEIHVDNANKYNQADYKFYNHPSRAYVTGLGDLIMKYTNYVKNITNDEGFLTIADSISGHEEAFHTKYNTLGFDLPKLDIIKELSQNLTSAIARKVHNIFQNQDTFKKDSLSSIWMQLPFTADSYKNTEPTAFYMFISLLRGVLIAPYDAIEKVGLERVKTLKETREKVPIQFGSFESMTSLNDTGVVAYTRVKSGSPGYFVILNPLDKNVTASFNSAVFSDDTSMELFMGSANFPNAQEKAKYLPGNIEIPAKSSAIFTFVPK